MTADAWERPREDLLAGFTNMYHPQVVHDPERERPFRMYFFGWATDDGNEGYPGCDAIFHARAPSPEGPWEVYAGDDGWRGDDDIAAWEPVVTADAAFYDNWHNGDPSVVLRDGTYYMALSATGFVDDPGPPEEGPESDDAGHKSCIVTARSDDGVAWEKSDDAVLISKPEREPDDYEHDYYVGIFHRPSLLYDGDRWRCWFDYKPGGGRGLSMGHAECRGDPLAREDWTVTNRLDDPLLDNWDNPDIVKIDGTYYAFGDPYGYGDWTGADLEGWPDRQLRWAVSEDGHDWRRLDFLDPDPDTPADHVPVAFVHDDTLYVYYSCQIGGDPYDFRYDRIRVMHRPVASLPEP